MLKRLLQFIGLVLVALLIVLLWNTFTNKSIQPEGEKMEPLAIDGTVAAEHLSEAIKYQTISEPAFYDSASFSGMHQYLRETYPLVFENLEFIPIGNYSFLLKWTGTNVDAKPILLHSHLDVVPIEESSKDLWEEEPFSGLIKDGYVWGRGAIDDKSTVIGLLESCHALLKQNFNPKRTVYLSFGEDEETGGNFGAQQAAAYFKANNIDFEAICDEGTLLTYNIVPGIKDRPVALIGISEKGYLTLELRTKIAGGHSSMPADENAVSLLTKGIQKLNENPFPYYISKPIEGFIKYMGPEMPFVQQLAFSNTTVMKSLIFNAYQKTNSGKAMIHTTMSPTVLKAGIKDNVVPTEATALVNFRILPGETIESTVEYVKNTMADDRIELTILDGAINPSEVSNYESEAFKQLGLAVKDVYEDALVTPFLMIGATDSRHFVGLSENIYKFMPVLFESEDLARFHGVNERIAIDNYKKAIQIYTQCILRWSEI